MRVWSGATGWSRAAVAATVVETFWPARGFTLPLRDSGMKCDRHGEQPFCQAGSWLLGSVSLVRLGYRKADLTE